MIADDSELIAWVQHFYARPNPAANARADAVVRPFNMRDPATQDQGPMAASNIYKVVL
jgi:hypothetical protein